MGLSAADLLGMQQTMNGTMPDTCALIHDTLTSDNAGGHTATPTTVTTVPCRAGPIRLTRSAADAEIREAGRTIPQSLWVLSFPTGTTIDPTYRVLYQSRTFEVVEVLAPRTYEVDVRVSCRLLNSGAG